MSTPQPSRICHPRTKVPGAREGRAGRWRLNGVSTFLRESLKAGSASCGIYTVQHTATMMVVGSCREGGGGVYLPQPSLSVTGNPESRRTQEDIPGHLAATDSPAPPRPRTVHSLVPWPLCAVAFFRSDHQAGRLPLMGRLFHGRRLPLGQTLQGPQVCSALDYHHSLPTPYAVPSRTSLAHPLYTPIHPHARHPSPFTSPPSR